MRVYLCRLIFNYINGILFSAEPRVLAGSNQAPKERPLLLDLSCSMPGHLVPDTTSLCGGKYKWEQLLPSYVLVNSNWLHLPPPLVYPRVNFLSERMPTNQSILLSNYPAPGPKMIVDFSGVGQNFSQSRRNCSLSLQEILKKLRKL